jgi:15,16-dihydrobiliverdin:ferredoxin oxidoreductase
MKPQHLLLVVPIFLSRDARVDAFADSRFPATNSQLPSSGEKAPLRMVPRSYEYQVYQPLPDISSLHHDPHVDAFMLQKTSVEHAATSHGMPWRTTIGTTEMTDPLLYMPFWEWQMNFMMSSLTNLRPDDSTMNRFGYRENKEKRARIVSQCYSSDEYRKIRMTYYDAGDNTQVFNSVFYPREEYNLPILGIDLLAFNRKKYLAIIDFQPIHDEESSHASAYEHRLKPIKDSYKSLNGKMSSRFYDETKFFSKQMLFSRFEDERVVTEELFPAFQRYVSLHSRLVRETKPEPSHATVVLDRHRAYDTYSAERDPATGLFTAMFGQDWAETFVFDFLFSMSDRENESVKP